MNRLGSIEQECQYILTEVIDYMAAGRRVITHKDHMELLNRIRICLGHLLNKAYGCASGKHAGGCLCKEGTDGKCRR